MNWFERQTQRAFSDFTQLPQWVRERHMRGKGMLMNEFWRRMSVCAFIASRYVDTKSEFEHLEFITQSAKERGLFFGGDFAKDKVILAIRQMSIVKVGPNETDTVAELMSLGADAWRHFQSEEVAHQCKQDLSRRNGFRGAVTEKGQFRM